MLKKLDSVFEVWMTMQLIMLLMGIVIWILNGGKNDFGFLHTTASNMVVAVGCIFILMLIAIIIAAIVELVLWVAGFIKQE